MFKTLLAVFAHPDDETFGPGGTLAKYAAEGAAVHLICATRGEVGESDLDDLRAALDHALPITTKIDVGPHYDAKRQAAACHQSQLSGPGSFWDKLPRWLVRRAQSTETFHRASPPFHRGERVERDLFANTDPEV
jgi:LmbE family N-acetylglucosaminyl deacetylase